MEQKRFAVLLCAEDSDYVKKKYGGYFRVFEEMLREEGELWEVYRVAHGEFPEDAEIDDFDGFVVTGSCNDAHGNDAWICKLVALLEKLHSLRKKVLGICFGHQILCRALGGKTGRAVKGWDIGLTSINLSPSKFPSALQIPSLLAIIECHRDEVWELPPFAEVMGWSEKTGIEMFRCGDHILGIQGHPEYNKDILMHLIHRLLQRNLIQVDTLPIQNCHAEAAKASMDAYEPDKEAWKRFCKSFLKGYK